MDRKENPISAPSIHVGALVHSGPGIWFLLHRLLAHFHRGHFMPRSCTHFMPMSPWHKITSIKMCTDWSPNERYVEICQKFSCNSISPQIFMRMGEMGGHRWFVNMPQWQFWGINSWCINFRIYNLLSSIHGTVVSRLSTQLEPWSFVRTLPVGAYFKRSIPKSPAFPYNVEETNRQAPEWVPALRDHLKTEQDEPSKQTRSSAWVRC
jgi:hypothetical protein